jgi:hypothetical protein
MCLFTEYFIECGCDASSLTFRKDCRLDLGTTVINPSILWLKVIGNQRKLHNV